MKILMLTTQLGYGGAETSFIRLANLLSQSMDVTVALFTGSGTYDAGHEPLHASVVLLDPPRGNKLVRWLTRLVKLHMLKRKHDATISFLSGPNLLNVMAGYNAHTVVSLRGSRFYDPVAPLFQRLIFQYIIDPIVFARAARIVPVSQGILNEIAAVSGRKVLAKTQVISPFVEPEIIAERLNEPLPEPFSNLAGEKVIVAVGRLSVEKGFHHLLRVFAALKHPTAKLLLVGNGPMEHALKHQCRQLGIEHNVIFAGYQKNVLPFMKLGTVYTMTSATEGFPNVLLEAMAAGLPIIAADTPWGARSILYQTPPMVSQPYPTPSPIMVDYGTLMPRIDLAEYQHLWVNELRAQLDNPPQAHPERVTDFSLARVGETWKRLLHELP